MAVTKRASEFSLSGLQRYAVELLAYQWMPNHWHRVRKPTREGPMSQLLRWVTGTHTMRYHAHYYTSGEGHVSQGRFKSFPVRDDDHFRVVCRYVQRGRSSSRIGCSCRRLALGIALAPGAKDRNRSQASLSLADCSAAKLGRASE